MARILVVALLVLAAWQAPVAAAAPADTMKVLPDQPNVVSFPPARARFVRFFIHASVHGQPCIDELEVYGSDGKQNLALASGGAKATASSCLPGYTIHQVAHLNDGLYGNGHSWIGAGTSWEWAQIELAREAEVASVVFSRDREGKYTDRMPVHFEIQLSTDGEKWKTVRDVRAEGVAEPAPAAEAAAPPPLPSPLTWDGLLDYAFLCEDATWQRVDRADSVARVLRQMADMVERLAAKGLDVAAERAQLADLKRKQAALGDKAAAEVRRAAYLEARRAKRQLFLRDPDLAPLQKILFVKRHPYEPSHNYSDNLDSRFQGGGGVCVLGIPRRDGRLAPSEGKVTTLFDAQGGIARDAMADFDARRVYFGYRSPKDGYYHIMVMNSNGGAARQLTEGPFNDYYPCPLPDGGLALVSTRCTSRFLCWRPQAFVLFRMEADGSRLRALSFANLSEWAPSVMRDGRILWTRSEYLDKGADFGHTLWAIRPDGTHPELIFGNDTNNCYMNGHEVPGTGEVACTLISHGGDLNGPVALVDPGQGRYNPQAIRSLTPDVAAHTHMSWARTQCFRDPVPVTRDYFLASHAPADRFGLYVIDRFGNREVLYLDPAIGSMAPTVLAPAARPPVLAATEMGPDPLLSDAGQFTVADVYQGLGPAVKRGTVKYLRVCQEVRSDLARLPDGQYRQDHEPFEDYYASPTHKVTGPSGWPSYVAKATLGLAAVEEDGSASFYAPAGKVLYFEALDGEFNEVQRMRSVVQLQPGERRSCVGCHEDRASVASPRETAALRHPPRTLQAEPWGAGPFAYEKVVQPVWDAQCVRCHDGADKKKIDLRATLDADRVPASYRTLIAQGWVHYFDYTWGREHALAAPLTFGTVKSRLWPVLAAGHYDVKLSPEEMRRVKCWIDLNCPLWPDYQYRLDRPALASHN